MRFCLKKVIKMFIVLTFACNIKRDIIPWAKKEIGN